MKFERDLKVAYLMLFE